MEGTLLVDKPPGITSYDVIRRLKKKLALPKSTKVGHAGTLDPLASGLMIIGIGPGTKKLKSYVGLPKTYEADVLFGIQTDTGDVEGEKIKEQEVNMEKLKEKIPEAVESLVGTHILPVSKYSATKIGGTPAYKLARAKKHVPNLKREMEVLSAELLGFDEEKHTVQLRLEVSSGTYIRSIAEELGRRLGVPATLSALRRTHVGEFDVEDAKSI